MSISGSISRFTDYCKRNGLRATLRRLGLATKRALFARRMVVSASIDAQAGLSRFAEFTESGTAHQSIDLSPQDLQEIINVWNPDQTRRNLQERFGLGKLALADQVRGSPRWLRMDLAGRHRRAPLLPLGARRCPVSGLPCFPQVPR